MIGDVGISVNGGGGKRRCYVVGIKLRYVQIGAWNTKSVVLISAEIRGSFSYRNYDDVVDDR